VLGAVSVTACQRWVLRGSPEGQLVLPLHSTRLGWSGMAAINCTHSLNQCCMRQVYHLVGEGDGGLAKIAPSRSAGAVNASNSPTSSAGEIFVVLASLSREPEPTRHRSLVGTGSRRVASTEYFNRRCFGRRWRSSARILILICYFVPAPRYERTMWSLVNEQLVAVSEDSIWLCYPVLAGA
jgi:hypothetical protein